MEKFLEQSAIDALFSAGTSEAGMDAGLAKLEAFNFRFAGQISGDQMRAISTVNDLFARNLMHTVGAWLRTEFQVTLVSGEQMAYVEFVERIAEKAYISLEPLGAPALLEVDLSLASPIVDLLLGGVGRAEPSRPLTDIEDLIMTSVVQMMVKELNVAWQPVGLQYTFEKRESSSQVARMMPAGEKILCVCFEVKMPEASGTLNLCLPAVVLNTILRKLMAVHDRPRRRSGDVRERMRELVGESTVSAKLQFPMMRLSAREVGALEVGTVLRLPTPRHAPAELTVGGLPMWQARAVRVGEHRGARLEPQGAIPAATAGDAG